VAKLILGPLLRRVVDDQAVLWVQTDGPATVTAQAGPSTVTAATFEVEGSHVAHLVLTGLPERATPYQVHVDGVEVWPEPGWPPSVITTGTGPDATVAFGSCREQRPYGVDALEAYANRALEGAPLPDLLALIGDQIYADELPEETQQWLSGRERPDYYPPNQVVTFAEYGYLYRKAWSQPQVRWLLSTVPTVMIFDDHEIMDDWNSSASWLADMQTRPWWDERIRAGLTSYWVFQHLGNMTPRDLAADPVWQRLQSDGKVEIPPGYRWSYRLDLGRTRMIIMDCRANRVLSEPVRRMFPQSEWDWLAEQAEADCDHLVLACSLPWLLAPAIHHVQAVMEVASRRYGGAVEKLRSRYDLEHWSAVGHSFGELTTLIQGVKKPVSISVLGGDVHHSYVAEATLPGRDNVYQITCSPLNNKVSGVMKFALRAGWWRGLSGPGSIVARLAGIPKDIIKWKVLTKPPYFGNAIATLHFQGRQATVLLECTDKQGDLKQVIRHRLA
jgi:phosphodiesterase/alkaline phosphatase D-like protein